MTDADDGLRVLVDATDRTGAVEQMRTLRARGYRGVFSFECTAPEIHALRSAEAAIAASISFLRDRLRDDPADRG